MPDSQGLVSVIVPVYNVGMLLPRCLESLSAQTYRNLEILLIDDGSTDDSGRLCDEFAAKDFRARVIHQENQGAWAVRNRGVEEAKGEYLIFADGDDCFHRDYVRLLYEAINLGGEAYPLAICDYRRVRYDERVMDSETDPSFEVMDQTALLDGIIRFPSCRDAFWGACWNKIYRKSALPEPFQRDFPRCQDYDSLLRLFFTVDKAVFVRKVLYYYVVWPGQNTATADDMRIRNECRCRIFLDAFMTLPGHLSDYKPELMANLYRRMIGWKHCSCGKPEQKVVSRKIRELEKKTYPYFWTCRRFTLRRKLHWLLSLHAPYLLRLFRKKITLEWA